MRKKLQQYTYLSIFFFLFTGQLYASQVDPLQVTQPQKMIKHERQFNLHAKIPSSDRCTLYILVHKDGQKIWFADLLKRKFKNKSTITVGKLIRRQEKLQKKIGTIVELTDLFENLKSFQYIETSPGSKRIMMHYIDINGNKTQAKFPLQKIYTTYTQDSSIFDYSNTKRSCIEEE